MLMEKLSVDNAEIRNDNAEMRNAIVTLTEAVNRLCGSGPVGMSQLSRSTTASGSPFSASMLPSTHSTRSHSRNSFSPAVSSSVISLLHFV